jgi:hypothetical protein
MDDPFARRLSQLLEITVLLRKNIDELLSGLTEQLEHALKGGSVAPKDHRRRRAKRA